MKMIICLITILCVANLYSSQNVKCQLDIAKNDEIIRLDAELLPAGSIKPIFCSDILVDVVYGDDPALGSNKLKVIRNKVFKQFEALSRQMQKDPNCYQCPLYKITAQFEGQLKVAPLEIKDPQTENISIIDGFGHPRFTKYRLIITGISNVKAVKRKIVR
jgi:hypothetical protein